MKVVFILFVTAIVLCVGNRTHGGHRHRHAKTGQKPERDTGSIILKPGTAKKQIVPSDKVWMYEEIMMNDDNLESSLLTPNFLKMLVQVELSVYCPMAGD